MGKDPTALVQIQGENLFVHGIKLQQTIVDSAKLVRVINFCKIKTRPPAP